MGLVSRIRESVAARRQAAEGRRYRAAVDAWATTASHLSERFATASNPPNGTLNGFTNARGESVLGAWLNVGLISPKARRVSNYSSVSYQATARTRVRTGGGTSTVEETPTVIDRGRLIITNQRAVLTGSRRTVEWPYRRLISVEHFGVSETMLYISGRQKSMGLQYPAAFADDIAFSLQLGSEWYAGNRVQFAFSCGKELSAHLRNPPPAPEGTPIDPRVVELAPSDALPAVEPPTEDELEPSDLEQPMVEMVAALQARSDAIRAMIKQQTHYLGLAATTVSDVHAALEVLAILPIDITEDGPNADHTSANQHARDTLAASDGYTSWGAVVTGDADWLLSCLDNPYSSGLVLLVGSRADLDSLEVPVADDGVPSPSVSGYSHTSTDDVVTRLKQAGMICYRWTPDDGHPLPVLRTAAAVLRHSMGLTVALVITADDPDVLRNGIDESAGFDELAIVASRSTLSAIGVKPLDDDDGGEALTAEIEASPELPAISVTVAGRTITDAASLIARYITERGRTIANYDFVAGTFPGVTPELVRATRLVRSRISAAQLEWFVSTGATADWSLVPEGASLVDADPNVVDDLYDKANVLYAHFSSSAPKGISIAKISKVLYLINPHLYPILDTRLTTIYRSAAKDAATAIRRTRTDITFKRMYWAAIRDDLLANAAALREVRETLSTYPDELVVLAAEKLSDLRLLDILTWDGAVEPEDDD